MSFPAWPSTEDGADMFLSTTYRLLFLEVPRTASNSVTDALVKLDPFSPTQRERLRKGPMYDYHAFRIPAEVDDTYTVVATSRNPYTRIWSHWKYRHVNGNPAVFTGMDCPTYLSWACGLDVDVEIAGAMRELPIAEMTGTDRVDHWLRYESLEESWAELAERTRIRLPRLRHLNRSTGVGDWSRAYDEERATMLADRYAKDFERFGYDPESWRPERDVSAPTPVPAVGAGQDTPFPGVDLRRRRVALCSGLRGSRPAYSLNRVIQDQLVMLLKHGYRPRLLVHEAEYWREPEWPFSDAAVELVQIPDAAIPTGKPASARQNEEILHSLLEALAGIDVVITHDLIYQSPAHLLHAAIRTANLRPDIKWFHWIHSATSPRLLKRGELASDALAVLERQGWPNSHPVFPSRMLVPRVAMNFNYQESEVRVVPHPIDVCRFFDFSPLSTRLYEEKKLYLADFMVVCPARLDRGKQVEWVIRIVSRLKSDEHAVRLVVLDYHSQGEEKQVYREELKKEARDWDLAGDELTFISEYDESSRTEIPHSVVRELFSISNVFINPSRSESYSLSTQEAAVTGNLLVLNADFPPMRELYGESALYYQFSSNVDRNTLLDGDTSTQFPPVQMAYVPEGVPSALLKQVPGGWSVPGELIYAEQIADRIRAEFLNNRVLRQRSERLRNSNIFSVFRRHLQPLINE